MSDAFDKELEKFRQLPPQCEGDIARHFWQAAMRHAAEVCDKHTRHVELSPGAGKDRQDYALATIEDIRNDLTREAGNG